MKITRCFCRISCSVIALATTLSFTAIGALADQPDQDWNKDHPKVKAVIAVQEELTPGLMSLDGILGTAVGQDDDGEATMLVLVNSEGKNPGQIMRDLPTDMRGARVKGLLTDPIRALGKPSGGGAPAPTVSHTVKQTPPIQLGTSGGWSKDLANGYCCGGTLGSLIQVNGVQYILSNYHVFESDIVPGGNGIVATTGDSVIQPGLIDVRCNAANAQSVATLTTIKSLPDSNVDASVAAIVPGMVSANILEIGTISSAIVSASIKQAVKKSGRTTRLTRSKVTGLNATVSVQYENECAGGVAFTKTFTGQIIISNPRSSFLNSGDSGSLMVQDIATNPMAVGLLYAGSSTMAVANPIADVLAFVGPAIGGAGAIATMVGK